jgi:hypothetical protein
LIKRWGTMANEPQHHGLKQALNEGIKSLHKWYSRVDGASSPAYFICLSKYLLYYFTTGTDSQLVLDPNVKDVYFQHRWSHEQYATGMKQLEDVVSYFIG